MKTTMDPPTTSWTMSKKILLPGLRRQTLCLAPHQHGQKFSGTSVCRVTFKHLPQPLRSHIRSFETLGQLLKCSKKNNKNSDPHPLAPWGLY